MGDDNPFERAMDLQEAEDDLRSYAAEKYPHVDFPPELFDAVLLRREGLSRAGLVGSFLRDAKSDIDAAAELARLAELVESRD